jgi:hypothetical protein
MIIPHFTKLLWEISYFKSTKKVIIMYKIFAVPMI